MRLLGLAWLLAALSLTAETVPQWTRFETAAESDGTYRNPLQEVEAEVELTAPSGRTVTVPAFWDYGRDWRARFSPDETGVWRYRWRSTADAGLDGPSGEFECTPYEGDNPLYRHGAVAVAPEGRHFEHADGTPFFWLGDTVWNGALLATREEWATYLARRREQKFSVVQFVATQWRSAAGNQYGRPAFIGRESVEVDPLFFQRLDERIEAINEAGLVASPVMFWANRGHPDLNPGLFLPEDQLIRLGRYLLARYGAHQVAWILGGDGRYEGAEAEKWKRVGRALFGEEAPGIDRPVTMHATYWSADAFADERWYDFAGYQSGHRRSQGVERIVGAEPTEFWKESAKPVLNIEPNYEAHRNREPGASPDDVFDAFDIRRTAWYSLLSAPPAGLTYGAHGLWAWHPRAEEPMTHPGTGVGPAWRDALELPGAEDLTLLVDLFETLDWTELRPAEELLMRQPGREDIDRWIAVARTTDGATVVAYLPQGGAARLATGQIESLEQRFWYSPRTGERIEAEASADGVFQAPSERDWVLVLGAR